MESNSLGEKSFIPVQNRIDCATGHTTSDHTNEKTTDDIGDRAKAHMDSVANDIQNSKQKMPTTVDGIHVDEAIEKVKNAIGHCDQILDLLRKMAKLQHCREMKKTTYQRTTKQ
ncbi:unnamed protein product [Owenia fusiformis]|uniref:Uncharacterized protein n=1 Tax=Owenia fusiformis TaxID=6347 RepID=A0A8S4PXG5_OWEFU|nr:unnamed protein product [Owenia fusiformis]